MTATPSFLSLILFCLLLCSEVTNPLHLKPDVQTRCSKGCISKHCGDAVLLRYGKYCGVLYTGCDGEKPCDGLDSCCMQHDHCIRSTKDYLNVQCNQRLLDCISDFRESGGRAFAGSTCDLERVEHTIYFAIKLGVWIGHGHSPPSDFNYTSSLP